ncbi:3-ketodihydrosphingosine reductase TSC10 [Mycena sanguinolenta]|uniref:3-dehydrosphinganine reductase n=1 Tax=Mycena sanguinolenta TaxID=230812 RepID=A0A8H6YC55_9AGAR|nr:3-ketodihydrosphingosine reductase TSC10 [Mycena sanguinolenta]
MVACSQDKPCQTNMLALVLIFLVTAAFLLSMFSFSSKWSPNGKHCYITGGSSGLGKALAILLTQKGAHVSIVARDEQKLRSALDELEKVRQSPSQKLNSYSYSINEAGPAADALEAVCAAHGGRCPDAIFLCAGTSTPGFFVEESEASQRKGMEMAYWVQASTALAAAKRMVRDRFAGKIVFTSSFLGYMSFIGYSSYSPGKHALRGLAETLRSELILYNIGVHILFPGTIYSPGYVEENKTKPKITLKIEETDEGLQPDVVAEALLRGVQNGNFHISSDLLGNLFRSSTRGATPHNNVFMDGIYSLLGWIGLPLWRRGVDRTIVEHRAEHEAYLVDKGFLEKK